MEILKKLLIFQEVTFRARKMKKRTLKMFLIFRELEHSGSGLKKLLIFQEELSKPKKAKFILLQKNL